MKVLNKQKKQYLRQAEQENSKKYDKNLTISLRHLKRVNVRIPFAKKIAIFLKENYNFESLRLRRDFSRLMDLIRCSATLHQYQREKNENRGILANEKDYEIARECIKLYPNSYF